MIVTTWPSTLTLAFLTWVEASALGDALDRRFDPGFRGERERAAVGVCGTVTSPGVDAAVLGQRVLRRRRSGRRSPSPRRAPSAPPPPGGVSTLTLALPKPRPSSNVRTSATLAVLPAFIGTCHEVPPSKSMPRLSPRTPKQQQAEHDERARDDQPAPAVLDELEVGPLVVEVGRTVPAGDAGDVFDFGNGPAAAAEHDGHDCTSGTSRPAPIPMPPMRTSAGRRASTETNGHMKQYAKIRSSAVDRPRKYANPRTDEVANR